MLLEPLISVLMPVRAYDSYTLSAVESILNQTHQHIELIIVGGADIKQLLTQLPEDPRIIGISRHATGIVSALNTGLAHCSGDYIARMDADDISHPTRLACQLHYARSNPDIQLIGANVRFINGDTTVQGGNQRYAQWLNSLTTPSLIRNACFIESPIAHPTFFAHKDVWSELGFYRDCEWPEDYDYVLRAWRRDFTMGKPDAVLLDWREHTNRLTKTDPRYSKPAFIEAKVNALLHSCTGEQLLHGRGLWLCGTGRNARQWHDALAQFNVNVLGFVDREGPKKKTTKRELPVISYTDLATQWHQHCVITAVNNPQARQQLLTLFTQLDRHIGTDFIIGA